MIISEFTVPELRFLAEQCNFTEEEMLLFDMRSHNVPLEECAELMNVSISTIKRMSQKVNSKIRRVRAE